MFRYVYFNVYHQPAQIGRLCRLENRGRLYVNIEWFAWKMAMRFFDDGIPFVLEEDVAYLAGLYYEDLRNFISL